MRHRIILKYAHSQDGILAWEEFKQEFEFDGARELCLETLEALSTKPYSGREEGGMAAYIDKYQSYMAQLAAIAPTEFSDTHMKRQLLINISQVGGIGHLIQPCRDNEYMTFDSVQHTSGEIQG